MQFENMREFLELSETLNFLTAADNLYMAQSTLSRHIKNMEEQLGAPLFNRNSKKIQLTQLGMRLLPYARQAVELQDAYMTDISEYLANLQSPLYIGLPLSWHSWGIADFLSDFQMAYSNVQINIVIASNAELPSKILNNEVGLALSIETDTVHDDGLSRIFYRHEPPLIALAPIHHPLAAKDTISIEELRTENLLLMSEDSFPYALSIQMCQDAGFEPKYSFKGLSGAAMYSFVEKGLGIALLPDVSDVQEHLVLAKRLTLQPAISSNINLIYKESALTESAQCFLDFFKASVIPPQSE